MTRTRSRLAGAAAIAVLAIPVLAGCSRSGSGADATRASAGASQGRAVASSAMADPTTSADIAQAKALVAKCISGTPLEQIHTIHLVFLSSASGKNGAQVTAARVKVFDCLGVPEDQRTNFKNAALGSAEKVRTKPQARTWLEATLPQLLLQYQTGGTPRPAPTVTTTYACTPASGTSPATCTPSPSVPVPAGTVTAKASS